MRRVARLREVAAPGLDKLGLAALAISGGMRGTDPAHAAAARRLLGTEVLPACAHVLQAAGRERGAGRGPHRWNVLSAPVRHGTFRA